MGCSVGYSARAESAPLTRWEQVNQRMEEARSKDEFRGFQARYPKYFGEEDPEQVSYAFVQTERYVYKGVTRCRAGDPRLIREVVTHGACMQGEAEGQCFQTMDGGLPEGDPCGRH